MDARAHAPSEIVVDLHLAWAAEVARLAVLVAAAEHNLEEQIKADIAQLDELRCRIALTPARTTAGIAAQIRLAIDGHEGGSTLGDAEMQALRNAEVALASMSLPGRPVAGDALEALEATLMRARGLAEVAEAMAQRLLDRPSAGKTESGLFTAAVKLGGVLEQACAQVERLRRSVVPGSAE